MAAKPKPDGARLSSTNTVIAALAMLGTVTAAVFAGWDKINPPKLAAASASPREGARVIVSGASASTRGDCAQVFQGVNVQGGLSINCPPADSPASAASR